MYSSAVDRCRPTLSDSGFVGIVDDDQMIERTRLGTDDLQAIQSQQFTTLVRDDDPDDFLGCAHGVSSRSISL